METGNIKVDTEAADALDVLISRARVIRSDRKTLSIGIKDGEIVVRAPKKMTSAAVNGVLLSHRDGIKRMVERYERAEAYNAAAGCAKLTPEEAGKLKKAALEYIPPRADYYAWLIGAAAEYRGITVRIMRTRWGSCSSKKNLNFNALMMLMPEHVADSIIAHEVCHLVEMNHSDRFYRLLKSVFPDYDDVKRQLREIGPAILNRI